MSICKKHTCQTPVSIKFIQLAKSTAVHTPSTPHLFFYPQLFISQRSSLETFNREIQQYKTSSICKPEASFRRQIVSLYFLHFDPIYIESNWGCTVLTQGTTDMTQSASFLLHKQRIFAELQVRGLAVSVWVCDMVAPR